ncbi:MAG: 16S rRNA (guanine(966)-N(2))-methyltransferase RsmD [Magnetococcales bacterium]|nr:16S rRNA (guanine(966)-N(2))-methyltransferase RsmD [Magnetococcales bacterium]
MVRISGGRHRGQPLRVPAGDGVRPTTGRVREALFSMLQGEIAGRWVLDLFAGSGLMGLEALSRGARFAVFIDSDAACCATIRDNSQRLRLSEATAILQGSLPRPATLARIESLCRQGPGVSMEVPPILFLDPPYHRGLAHATLMEMQRWSFLVPGTLAVVEHEEGGGMGPFSSWEPLQCRRYGDTRISVFSKIGGQADRE